MSRAPVSFPRLPFVQRSIVGALGFAASCGVSIAIAQSKPAADAGSYPERPVRVVVPYAPEGSSDAVARILSQKLTGSLGQQIVIDNRPGAAGSLGIEVVVRASPDGHTLLVGEAPHAINVDVLKHVQGVDVLVSNRFGLFGPAQLPALILAKLHKVTVEAIHSADGQKHFGNLSLDIATTSSEAFLRFLVSKLKQWGEVVKAAGIKAK